MTEKDSLLERHVIGIEATLRDAIAAINRLSGHESMTLFATDSDARVCGTITDGDIRRALLQGVGLDDSLQKAMHRQFLAADGKGMQYEVFAEARRKKIDLLPVLEDGKLCGMIDMRVQHAVLPIDAVLMAGGRGERLRPLTLNCPKPLLEVGGKPVIDYNVDELLANGVSNIFVTVNYLHEQIEEHFADTRFQGKVKCILEPKRLGTIGSMSLIEGFTHDHVLLMNSDLLTTLNYEKFFLAHIESGADLTIATIPYTVSIPFAIIKSEGERVTGLSEKPTYNYFANAGVYLMKREVVGKIPKGEYLDAPDLIESLIAEGGHVSSFPIEGIWLDIGSPDDFRYANELMTSMGRTLNR